MFITYGLVLFWIPVLLLISPAIAQYPNTEYGNIGFGNGRNFDPSSFERFQPSHHSRSGQENSGNFQSFQNPQYFSPDSNSEGQDSQMSQPPKGGKIHKFVSIHVAPPEEPKPKGKKPKKPPQKPEKHYQIVFIKAPSPSPQDEEIQLPPLPETKTLVYVLLKKSSVGDMVRFKGQQNQRPTPPEVFFIRYKGKEEQEKKGQYPQTNQNKEKGQGYPDQGSKSRNKGQVDPEEFEEQEDYMDNMFQNEVESGDDNEGQYGQVF